MNETIKLATEIAKIMIKYHITEDQMNELIATCGGNVKLALKSIETSEKVLAGLN